MVNSFVARVTEKDVLMVLLYGYTAIELLAFLLEIFCVKKIIDCDADCFFCGG